MSVVLEPLRAIIGKRIIATKKPVGAQYLGMLDKVSPKCGWLDKHTKGRWFTPEKFTSVVEDPEYNVTHTQEQP